MSHPASFGPNEFQNPADKEIRNEWHENRHEHFIQAQIDLMNKVLYVAKTSKPIPEKKASRTPYFKDGGK